MKVRVLGPLSVLEDDRALQLGGPQQRLLLAFLAANVDHAVTIEALIDGLWGEQPPDTARTRRGAGCGNRPAPQVPEE